MADLYEQSQKPILSVRNLKMYFHSLEKGSFFKQKTIKAVDDVSFDLFAGETLGIVGESGSGKSTLVRTILKLLKPTAGTVSILGQDFLNLSKKQLRLARRNVQMIFQDPLESLDPRMTVKDIIAEPLHTFYSNLSQSDVDIKITKIIQSVGLIPEHLNRYPHEFSGGQCQRIGIARALILEPKIVVCDEPVSALDVSIQAQIINLLKKLQKELSLTFIFIAHDLSIVKYMSNRVLIMHLGKIVEAGTKEDIYQSPKHPYTKTLLDSVPITDPKLERARMVKFRTHHTTSTT